MLKPFSWLSSILEITCHLYKTEYENLIALFCSFRFQYLDFIWFNKCFSSLGWILKAMNKTSWKQNSACYCKTIKQCSENSFCKIRIIPRLSYINIHIFENSCCQIFSLHCRKFSQAAVGNSSSFLSPVKPGSVKVGELFFLNVCFWSFT